MCILGPTGFLDWTEKEIQTRNPSQPNPQDCVLLNHLDKIDLNSKLTNSNKFLISIKSIISTFSVPGNGHRSGRYRHSLPWLQATVLPWLQCICSVLVDKAKLVFYRSCTFWKYIITFPQNYNKSEHTVMSCITLTHKHSFSSVCIFHIFVDFYNFCLSNQIISNWMNRRILRGITNKWRWMKSAYSRVGEG
jgi:hypothetical protein